MQENDRIYLDARLLSVVKDGVFRAKLRNGHVFVAYSGKRAAGGSAMSCAGAEVRVKMSPYDMSKGLIVGQPEK